MYLHECYLIPAPALNAVVEYLKERPYKEAAPLLEALNGHPNGSAEGLAKAGLEVHQDDLRDFVAYVDGFRPQSALTPQEKENACDLLDRAERKSLPTPGETVVEFPAGVARRE